MKYFISAFMPFMAFFYIKKPVYGYISLLFYLLAIASWSVYPSALLLCLTYVILLMWSFFEINDYHSKLIAKKMIDFLKKTNPSINYDGDDEDNEYDEYDDEEPRAILESVSRPKYDKYFDKSIVIRNDAQKWQNNSKGEMNWTNKKAPRRQEDDEDDDYYDMPLSKQPRSMAGRRSPYQEQQSTGLSRYSQPSRGGSRRSARR